MFVEIGWNELPFQKNDRFFDFKNIADDRAERLVHVSEFRVDLPTDLRADHDHDAG